MEYDSTANLNERWEYPFEADGGTVESREGACEDSRAMEELFLSNPETLMEEVVHRTNMIKAYRRVMANKGSAGVDEVEVQDLKAQSQTQWPEIRESLLKGTYKPQPVKKVEIPKPGGDTRMLGVPTVMDRLIQQAVGQVMNPIFDKDFSEHSYGFRPGKSAHQAIGKSREYINSGRRWVVDIDLSKFFDRVNHDILMHRVSRKIRDKRLLRLIGSYLRAGIWSEGRVEARREGTPQGGPLSPLLANILLDDLDKELENRGHKFCRYADDCNIYVNSQRAGERVMASVTRYLERSLKLVVNREKSAVGRPWKRKFLGYSFTPESETRAKIAPASLKKAKQKLREIFRKGKGRNIKKTIAEVNRFIVGWFHYFRLSGIKSRFQELDEWIRHHLRKILWCQWKRNWTRRKRLMALGMSEEHAVMSAFNRRGPWWNSGASHMNRAIPIATFKYWGLNSLFVLYSEIMINRNRRIRNRTCGGVSFLLPTSPRYFSAQPSF